jgi:Flp pilus assembly protein TadG
MIVPNAQRKRLRRSGAVMLEAAMTLPLLFFFLFCLIVGGVGVYRYQAVAWLSREAAQYASSRGLHYQLDTQQNSPTEKEIIASVVTPRAVSLDPSALTTKIEWIDQSTGTVVPWDSASKSPISMSTDATDVTTAYTNTVRVTVTYQWVPEMFLKGPITLQSVSETPMSN